VRDSKVSIIKVAESNHSVCRSLECHFQARTPLFVVIKLSAAEVGRDEDCPLKTGYQHTSAYVGLGDVLVIVIAIGPKVRGFNPGRGRWIFKGDNNPQHTFLRREVKQSSPCKIYGMLKNSAECERGGSSAKFTVISIQISSCFALDYWLLVTARELWWMNQELFELGLGRRIDKNVAVHGTLCAIPPRTSNITSSCGSPPALL
jgi:hypothetical protein